MKELALILIIFLIFAMIGLAFIIAEGEPAKPSTQSNKTTQEQFTVQCEVVEYYKDHWYAASAHRYRMSVKVYCPELDMYATFEDTASGMFISSKLWDLKKGDIIDCVAVRHTDGEHTRIWIDHVK